MKFIDFLFIFGINFVSQEDPHLFDLDECYYGKKFCILYPTGCLETKGLTCEHGASVRQIASVLVRVRVRMAVRCRGWFRTQSSDSFVNTFMPTAAISSFSTMEVELFTTKINDNITNTWMGLGFRDKSNCLPYCSDSCEEQCYQNAPFIECAMWGNEDLVPALSYNKYDKSDKHEALYYVETDMGVLEKTETFVNDTYLYCRMKQWIQGDQAAANVKKYKDANYVLVYSKQVEYAMMTTWGSTNGGVNDGGNKCQFKEDASSTVIYIKVDILAQDYGRLR